MSFHTKGTETWIVVKTTLLIQKEPKTTPIILIKVIISEWVKDETLNIVKGVNFTDLKEK